MARRNKHKSLKEKILEAPCPIPPTNSDQPVIFHDQPVIHKRVHKVVGYRNSKHIHSLSDLNDPHFAGSEWLVRWEGLSSDRDSWLSHAECMESIVPSLKKFIANVHYEPAQHGLELSVGYVSAIEDVKVEKIFSESDTHYFVHIKGFSESFVYQATHPIFSKLLQGTKRQDIDDKNRFKLYHWPVVGKLPFICVPKEQLVYIYPNYVKYWETTEPSQRSKFDHETSVKRFKEWELENMFEVQEGKPSNPCWFTRIHRPSTEMYTSPYGSRAGQYFVRP